MIGFPLAGYLPHLQRHLLELLHDRVQVLLAQDEEVHLRVGSGGAISPVAAVILKEDVRVPEVGALHVGDEGQVETLHHVRVVQVDVIVQLDLTLLDEID
jgi:hypothetical protein